MLWYTDVFKRKVHAIQKAPVISICRSNGVGGASTTIFQGNQIYNGPLCCFTAFDSFFVKYIRFKNLLSANKASWFSSQHCVVIPLTRRSVLYWWPDAIVGQIHKPSVLHHGNSGWWCAQRNLEMQCSSRCLSFALEVDVQRVKIQSLRDRYGKNSLEFFVHTLPALPVNWHWSSLKIVEYLR